MRVFLLLSFLVLSLAFSYAKDVKVETIKASEDGAAEVTR